MSKRAEEAALETYPAIIREREAGMGGLTLPYDANTLPRKYFKEGYEQAEQDLKLTADDIGAILMIYFQMMRDEKYRDIGREAICDEALKRFYELE